VSGACPARRNRRPSASSGAVSAASRFPRVQAAGLGSLPQTPTEELAFVQRRVALLGQVTFFISGMFLIAVGLADYLRPWSACS
jgi:hypothetical protein